MEEVEWKVVKALCQRVELIFFPFPLPSHHTYWYSPAKTCPKNVVNTKTVSIILAAEVFWFRFKENSNLMNFHISFFYFHITVGRSLLEESTEFGSIVNQTLASPLLLLYLSPRNQAIKTADLCRFKRLWQHHRMTSLVGQRIRKASWFISILASGGIFEREEGFDWRNKKWKKKRKIALP